MRVVSNTTPLNYLILTESIHVLPAIFGNVYTPSAVIKELSHPRSPGVVRTWASNPPQWLNIRDPSQPDPSLKLGIGEAAAISLALELRADQVLIDERKGYKAVLQRGLKAATTLGILEEASHRSLIDFAAVIEQLDQKVYGSPHSGQIAWTLCPADSLAPQPEPGRAEPPRRVRCAKWIQEAVDHAKTTSQRLLSMDLSEIFRIGGDLPSGESNKNRSAAAMVPGCDACAVFLPQMLCASDRAQGRQISMT